MIELGDGSMGMLPEEWLKKYGMLADLGTGARTATSGSASRRPACSMRSWPRSRRSGSTPPSRRSGRTLRQFEGVVPLDSPPGFHGELRPYQREGLGWLDYLQRFGFGGILADDMGLGKTIQVLALLAAAAGAPAGQGADAGGGPPLAGLQLDRRRPSKFTPRLRVLDYTGPGRHALRESFRDYDLIVTTYGTLRTDIAELTPIEFDYAILDEAQAIKNAESQSAKAARLLARPAPAGHERHADREPPRRALVDLRVPQPGHARQRHGLQAATPAAARRSRTRTARLLAKALRPFILRRTKQQVVKDLPEKTEQTLYCDMEADQRQLYDELRLHYRDALLAQGRRRAEPLEDRGPRSAACGSARRPATPA